MDIILNIVEAIMITWAVVLRDLLTAMVFFTIYWSIYSYYAISKRSWRHAIRIAIRVSTNLGVLIAAFLIFFLGEMITYMPGQLGYAEIAVILGMILAAFGITNWWYGRGQI